MSLFFGPSEAYSYSYCPHRYGTRQAKNRPHEKRGALDGCKAPKQQREVQLDDDGNEACQFERDKRENWHPTGALSDGITREHCGEERGKQHAENPEKHFNIDWATVWVLGEPVKEEAEAAVSGTRCYGPCAEDGERGQPAGRQGGKAAKNACVLRGNGRENEEQNRSKNEKEERGHAQYRMHRIPLEHGDCNEIP